VPSDCKPAGCLEGTVEDDQIAPAKDSAKKSARLIKGAQEIYYPGRPHGMHQDEVNADLPGFLNKDQKSSKAALSSYAAADRHALRRSPRCET
jgi:hypothetical protein